MKLNFTVTRDRILGEARERYPLADLGDLRVLTRAEVDRVAGARGWCTRTGSGGLTFDWAAADAALGRELSPIEQRILRESVLDAGSSDLDELVNGLDTFLAE